MSKNYPSNRSHGSSRWAVGATAITVLAFLLVLMVPNAAFAWPNPSLAGSVSTGSEPVSVCVQGGYAYLVNYDSDTLQVFDVSDPTSPTSAGTAATGDQPFSVCVQEGYAYVVNQGSDTLEVFDVSNPTVPTSAGSAATGSYPRSVCVQGSYAYVVNGGSDTLQVFDVSDPTVPTSAGSAATGSYPRSVCVQGGYAYVVNGASDTLEVFDVSNPTSPTSVGSAATGDNPRSVCVQGGQAFVANYDSDTLEVFDVSDPTTPTLAGSAATGDNPRSVCVQGGYAYVANIGSSTLQAFDVSDPTTPTSAGSVATGSGPRSVCVQGAYAYVVNEGSDTLEVFNVSDPTSPISAGTAATGELPYSVCVQGGYAYVVNAADHTLQVFDVSDPTSPISAGTAATGVFPYSVCVQGGYAYAVNFNGDTLEVFDVSDPTSPTSAGTADTGELPISVCVQGSYAYVATSFDNTLEVFDVSDPTTPTLAGSAATGGIPFSVCVQGSYAYVVNGSDTLEAFDVSDPTMPTSAGSAATGSEPVSVCVQGGYAYLVNNDSDTLQVFRLWEYETPTVTTTAPSNIDSTTADSGGNVTDDGGATVTRGVCWSQSADPTIADDHTTDGTGTGTFISDITGLTPGTLYHVRAYATNSEGTSYGTDEEFTTLELPTVTTTALSNIDSTTADSGGEVTDDGGATVTARGVCWSESADPTVADDHTTDGTGTGTFISDITGLTPGTLYHVRAYATNSVGTAYGADEEFTTLDTPTVTTIDPSDMLSTEVDSGGNVTDDGGATVTARGVCWSESADPTIADDHTTDGTGTGVFISDITGLTPGTLYHVRAYATNFIGTSYGEDKEFTTDAVPPTLTTNAATSITETEATLNGSITNTGGEDATQRGFRYRKAGTSTWTDWNEAGSYSTGTFNYTVEGLDTGTAYEYQAYATNSAGTSYGDEQYFTTVELPPTTWYLAEGTTAWGFDTYITVENPNNEVVDIDVTYMTADGQVDGGAFRLYPMSQLTINPEGTLGERDFSTRIDALKGKTIAVDRTMEWTGTGAASPEAHNSIGVNAPSKTWYLPEGSSAWGFETWLLIQNPSDTEATCTVTYMIEGEGPVTLDKKIPAGSRRSYNMADDIGTKDASIKVESDVPVIPERAVYRNNRREGHDSIGTTTPASDYYLAEGCTGYGPGFTTYVLVQNPNDSANNVTVTYLSGSGEIAGPTFPMAPNSRKTIKVNDGLPPDTDVSTHVHADSPIIAERAMYWTTATGEACHDSIGMAQAHKTFYLPDGQICSGRETWTLVSNPNDSDVQVEISYLTPTGEGNVVFTETIPANSRKSFNMGDKKIAGRAAVLVECLTDGKKIMCERAMYWNDRGAGTDTIGGYSD